MVDYQLIYLKGKITYVNEDFIRISQFSEQELLNAPHNLVRHPDMPAEAFDDRRFVANPEKGQGMDWIGQKPLQERRLLLGRSQCRAFD